MKAQFIAFMMILSSILFLSTAISFALTTDELVQLKKVGVSEDTILFMLDTDYKDVGKILKLKEAGFKDETILSIIRNDLKGSQQTDTATMETKKDASEEGTGREATSKIKILWYVSYGGGPVLLSSQAEDNVKISAEGNTLKFEWKDRGLFNIFLKKPFKSPFYWDINKDDAFGAGKEGYAYMLRSTMNHKGRPDTDGTHYWVVYFDAKDPSLADYLKDNLSNK